MKTKIQALDYNWLATTGGEWHEQYIIGKIAEKEVEKVINIEEIMPKGRGELLYYKITLENGDIRKIFNANKVYEQKITTI